MVWCFMALAAGMELKRETQPPKRVSISKVDPQACVANGRIMYVTEPENNPGVYTVRCQSGVNLPAVSNPALYH